MPRPQKCRRVCQLPRWAGFIPAGTAGTAERVILTVDEYEVIRLVDLEGLTQEACAAQMEIARTTVTGIYDGARRKLAEALVHGKALVIQGGNYRLCDGGTGRGCCQKRGCCRKHQTTEEKRHENRSDL